MQTSENIIDKEINVVLETSVGPLVIKKKLSKKNN